MPKPYVLDQISTLATNVNNLQQEVANKIDENRLIEYAAPIKHTHTADDITGLSDAITGVVKEDAFNEHVNNANIHFGINTTANVDGTLYRGTTAPTGTTKLNYSGYFEATRVYGSYYSDYAEFFNVISKYAPGTVIEISGDNEYDICNTDKSPLAIGVISEEYHTCIGYQPHLNNSPIALSGKVHVNIQSPVHRGDFLVSAGNGQARALEENEFAPRGTILGQALEDSDFTQVLMLVGRM